MTAENENIESCAVALKRIKMHNENHDGFPLTCLREIKTLRRCAGHENIVSLLDIVVGRNRDAVFLLFEYCEHDLVSYYPDHPLQAFDIWISAGSFAQGLAEAIHRV